MFEPITVTFEAEKWVTLWNIVDEAWARADNNHDTNVREIKKVWELLKRAEVMAMKG